MEKNKTGKYFKYAIGEIVLVVIGILIALSINSWNQKRLEHHEEKEILNNLKGDYQNAIEEFEFLNSIRSAFISAAKDITLINVKKIEQYPEKYMDSLFEWTLYNPTFNNKSGSLQVLFNSGKINLIRNKELRNILIEWPGDVADMTEDEVTHTNLFNNVYQDLLSNYVVWNNLAATNIDFWVRFDKPIFVKMPSNPILRSDYKSLLNNKKFLNTLHIRVRTFSGNSQETNSLVKKAKNIIKMIDKELEE